ncbi:hypothetical protein KB562_10300 [Pasteurella atlantica]|nr:hypothetical protein [Pasteurella atlantica]QVE21089.1 hypothetical protein KGI96_01455 [Pasteurella atlantica]
MEYIFYYNNDRIKLKFGRLSLLYTQLLSIIYLYVRARLYLDLT